KFANPIAAQTHINLKTTNDLLKLSNDYFKNSFIFSMNDEVVHTGYHGMSHYIFVLGVGLK
ncbi:SAM-dependent methyltransferase, partial [Alphaproteobacteria bacterium]|nr:SAM-dependent methyltransferase [Alphaproteobacteria bacterium]